MRQLLMLENRLKKLLYVQPNPLKYFNKSAFEELIKLSESYVPPLKR